MVATVLAGAYSFIVVEPNHPSAITFGMCYGGRW